MNLKALRIYLPYLSGMIIILGVIHGNFYYNDFGIDIENYLNISELLLLFIDYKILILIVICFGQFASIKYLLRIHELRKIEKLNVNGNSKKYLLSGEVAIIFVLVGVIIYSFLIYSLAVLYTLIH